MNGDARAESDAGPTVAGRRLARFDREEDRRRRRSLHRSRMGMSAAHAAVLIMGLLVLAAGLYLLVANGSIFTGPAIALPIIGLILVFLGLADEISRPECRNFIPACRIGWPSAGRNGRLTGRNCGCFMWR